mgnify:CR=1 FL=1
MGKGTVQKNAISEVANLPANSPYKGNALDLFLSLKLELESKQPIEPEERNLAMRLSALYIEFKKLNKLVEQKVVRKVVQKVSGNW